MVDEKRPSKLVKIGLGLLSEKKPLPLGFWAWFQFIIYECLKNCFEIPLFVLERKKIIKFMLESLKTASATVRITGKLSLSCAR